MSDCLICGAVDARQRQHPTMMASVVECAVCGSYVISILVETFIAGDQYEEIRKGISHRIREATDRGEPVVVSRENFRDLGAPIPPIPVSRKRFRFLELIAKSSEYPGKWTSFDPRILRNRLLIANDEELDFITGDLIDRQYINRRAQGHSDSAGEFIHEGFEYRLTPYGWEQVEPIVGSLPGTCFVAMSFDPTLSSAFDDGIAPAVERDCGLTVLRVDRVEHNDNITDRILAGIRSAQLVVADFTLQRQGVYFEAGFALGLGKIVNWTCRKDDFANVHFDTRQYNHIVWESPSDLRTKLAARIQATAALPVRLGNQ